VRLPAFLKKEVWLKRAIEKGETKRTKSFRYYGSPPCPTNSKRSLILSYQWRSSTLQTSTHIYKQSGSNHNKRIHGMHTQTRTWTCVRVCVVTNCSSHSRQRQDALLSPNFPLLSSFSFAFPSPMRTPTEKKKREAVSLFTHTQRERERAQVRGFFVSLSPFPFFCIVLLSFSAAAAKRCGLPFPFVVLLVVLLCSAFGSSLVLSKAQGPLPTFSPAHIVSYSEK
jgi:hypothetical protein